MASTAEVNSPVKSEAKLEAKPEEPPPPPIRKKGPPPSKLPPEVQAYYSNLLARHELTRSDVSIFPSYTHVGIPYFVVCRQRYSNDGLKQRKQFIKEICVQEAIENRALGGVRTHREFCDPYIVPLAPEDAIVLTRKEMMHLEEILTTDYH